MGGPLGISSPSSLGSALMTPETRAVDPLWLSHIKSKGPERKGHRAHCHLCPLLLILTADL